MEKDLRMEVFASKDVVKPTSLHVYELRTQEIDNRYKIIRSAVWKIRSHSQAGVFEDGEKIYTTQKIEENIPNTSFTLEYEGLKELPVLCNRKIYCDLIKYLISQKLSLVKVYGNYRKYSCKDDITSKWIMTERGFATLSTKNKEINLEREYDLWVRILDNGKAYLEIYTKSLFTSKLTINDYMERNKPVIETQVKNDWSNNNQMGILTKICDFTVTDKLDFADSLKAYYISLNQEFRVKDIPDDTRVVMVKMSSGKEIPYYPNALKPVITREKLAEIDPEFSRYIEPYIKRNMETRLQLDVDFINDIGSLHALSDLEFNTETCAAEELGYKPDNIPLPKLICGNDRMIECGKEIRVFSCGFYKKTDKAIKIGYIYPEGAYDLMKAVANAVYSFACLGKYQGARDQYTKEKLLNFSASSFKGEYALGDITDYKRAALKLQKEGDIDIVVALIPDEAGEDDAPYNPFKKIWAKANIPSQMITMKTARLFAKGKAAGTTSKYYLHNIVLGILGKTGGIPWVVKDMPGDVDCFVGLDVATADKGIHYPACSVVFDKYGRLIGFYKPEAPQKGEKISREILQDIFDQVVISYENKYQKPLKNIVIHRDGFSNEDDDWYQNYFSAKGIEYSIIEVKKNTYSKLMLLQDGKAQNPAMGYCIHDQNKGYLITTDIKDDKGSPNPILIEKKCGDISMEDVLTQILYLSQLHVGSTHKMRLPITTGYADKICKNRDFVPEGQMDDRLFFL